MSVLAFIIISFLAIKDIQAQSNITQQFIDNGLIYNGTCPNLTKSMSGFSDEEYTGLYFLHSASPSLIDQNKKCTYWNITMKNNVGSFTKYDISTSTNELEISRGTIDFDFNAGIGYYHFTYPTVFEYSYSFIGGNSDYWIDYKCNSCSDYGTADLGMHIYVWSRASKPNCTVFEAAEDILKSVNLTLLNLVKIDQTGCNYNF